ncbi:hypothetical protein [Phaeobacter sp. NW0010-22]|uniref:hypothetical protein n=1 Tax=Phaeobacter sp. NW0010-22 TaxID=3135907 RepID=UPI0031060A2F
MITPNGFAAVLCLLPLTGQAQDMQSLVEMPGHRALIEVGNQSDLKPFVTDGCSGGLSYSWTLVADTFPDFAEAHNQLPPWENCCVIHDRAYHNMAGAETAQASYDARVVADEALQSCVVDTGSLRVVELAELYGASQQQVLGAYETIAGAMYLAVRFGGGPCSGLPWRWGYGYPECSVFGASSGDDSPARE